MSTAKVVTILHPSSAVNNIVNDASGNVAVGGTLTASTITSPASTALTIQSAGTTAMTVDTSQNVGIGTTSTSAARLNVFGTGTSTSFRGNINAIFGSNGSGYDSTIRFTDSVANSADISMKGGVLATSVNGVFATYIDSSGNLLVRTTTAGGLLTIDSVSGGTTSTKLSVYGYGSGRGYGIEFRPNTDTGATPCRFLNAAGTEVGYISTSSSGATYSTTSDYRLKNSVAPLNTGLATVSALKPVTYKWNVDDSNGEGFIAHELHSVIPLAVQGEKDAVDDEGNIKPQGVDYSKIVVHLVAAIQELSAKNDALEARLAALEAK